MSTLEHKYMQLITEATAKAPSKMTEDEVVAKLTAAKGKFVTIYTERPVKTRKGVTDVIMKYTRMSGLRPAVEYDSTAAVKQGRADGSLPAENAGLQGKEHIGEDQLFLKSQKSGEVLVNLQVTKAFKSVSEYTFNGKPVEKAELQGMVLASELGGSSGPTLVIHPRLSTIIYVETSSGELDNTPTGPAAPAAPAAPADGI